VADILDTPMVRNEVEDCDSVTVSMHDATRLSLERKVRQLEEVEKWPPVREKFAGKGEAGSWQHRNLLALR
jgi:hypothetical protein